MGTKPHARGIAELRRLLEAEAAAEECGPPMEPEDEFWARTRNPMRKPRAAFRT